MTVQTAEDAKVSNDARNAPNSDETPPKLEPKPIWQKREKLDNVTQEFHYLDTMAQRMEHQMGYVHQKQSIMFSLSAGMIAVLIYTNQSIFAMAPFFFGTILTLVSIVPIFSRPKSSVKTNMFFYGTMPKSIMSIANEDYYTYAQALLNNLHDLTVIVVRKNRLISASAWCFFFGILVLMTLAALGMVKRLV